MTPEIVLHKTVNAASKRIRLLLVYKWASRALCVGAAGCLVWLLASKLNWIDEPRPETLAAIITIFGLVGIGFGLFHKITQTDAARLTDERTGMKERLGSAIEFDHSGLDDPILRRQIQDAGTHAGTLNIRKVFPIRVTREVVAFTAVALVIFGSFFLPNLPIFWSSEKKKEMEQVKKQGIVIERVAKDAEKSADKQKLDESKKASKEAQKLAAAMKKGKLDKKQSLIQMQKLTKKLQEQQKRMAALNTPATKPMEKAAQDIKKSLEDQQKALQDSKQQNQDAAKSGEKPQKPGEQKNAQNKEQTKSMQKAQEALKKFAQALAQQNPQMQNQAMQELADQLQKGEMSQKEMDQLKDQMKEIAQALSKTDLDKVSKQLAELAKLMEQMKLDPQTLKKLAAMARQAGGT